MSSLQQRKHRPQRTHEQWQATLPVSGLRAPPPRASTTKRLYCRRARRDSAGLSRAPQFAWPATHFWRLAQHRHQLAQKKHAALPELSQTLAAPDPVSPTILELDELWSVVLKKANKRWIWIALCRPTRQVVAYVTGDRSEATCQRLWERLPTPYRAAHCYSDFWEAYQQVIPAEQLTPVSKESGQTAHVERWNNTLRQRLARFVRKTLSFSKSEAMHEICLRLFLHYYNLCLVSSG